MSAILAATNPEAAADALSAALSAALAPLSAAVGMAREAQGALRDADGDVSTMQAGIGVILALEAVKDAASAGERAARVALAEAMSLGATTISNGNHTASLRDAPRVAMVMDAKALPPHYFVQPPPKPDLVAIRKALLAGPVAGAELSNGGQPTVAIRSTAQ